METKVDAISNAKDEIEDYRYQFNVKFTGVPETSANESSRSTSSLCTKLFNKMGAEVTILDIDTAHRVPSRSDWVSAPKPIIWKFVRCLQCSKGAGYGMTKRCRQREPFCYWSPWSSFPVWGQNLWSFNAKDAIDHKWSEEIILKTNIITSIVGPRILWSTWGRMQQLDRSRSTAWMTYIHWLTKAEHYKSDQSCRWQNGL